MGARPSEAGAGPPAAVRVPEDSPATQEAPEDSRGGQEAAGGTVAHRLRDSLA